MNVKTSIFSSLVILAGLNAPASSPTMTPADGYPEFALGADVSWLPYIEENNLHTYYTAANTGNDFITTVPAMLNDYGVDAVRLRVWVNPYADMAMSGFTFKIDGKSYEEMSTFGTCSVSEMVTLAVRLANRGQRIMVSFQMSDQWADPGRQFIPASWSGCNTVDELQAKAVAHVQEVLRLLYEGNVNVAWVQIGNETNNGMLEWELPATEGGLVTVASYGCQVSQKAPDVPTETTYNFVKVFNACADAAKAIYPDTKTVMHLTKTSEWATLNWSLNLLVKAGLDKSHCDYIGLSLYPGVDDGRENHTADWKKYADLGIATIDKIYKTYGFRTILVETGLNNEYSNSIDVTQISPDKLQAAGIEQCDKDVKACTQYLIDKLAATECTCDGMFYWEPQTDYMKGYPKGACVSITPGADWSRDKVTPNAWWHTVKANSTFPAGGLKEYVINPDQTPSETSLYIVGDFNAWNYDEPLSFDYDQSTGLYSATVDCLDGNSLWLSISDRLGQTDFTANQYTPYSMVSNGVTANIHRSASGFSLPYHGEWHITLNLSRGTINCHTTSGETSTGEFKELYLCYNDTETLFVPMTTQDGILYSLDDFAVNQWFRFKIVTKDWTLAVGDVSVEIGKETTLGSINGWDAWTAEDIPQTCTWWYRLDTSAFVITEGDKCPWDVTSDEKDHTVKYDNSLTKWNVVYAYVQDAEGNPLGGVWPGKRMDGPSDGDIWTLDITTAEPPATISFSNGLNASSKETFENGKVYENENSVIINVCPDNMEGPEEYYNLQGIRVNNPKDGLYIIRIGNKSKKIVIR